MRWTSPGWILTGFRPGTTLRLNDCLIDQSFKDVPVNDDLCSQFAISCKEEAPALRESLLDVAGLSELFKAMADESRIKILHLLSRRELCVCDLAFILETNLPAISHHLRFLKMLNLVKSRREGKLVFYSLADDHVLDLLQTARNHYMEKLQDGLQ
jgi:ArsR family transcriptional regulator